MCYCLSPFSDAPAYKRAIWQSKAVVSFCMDLFHSRMHRAILIRYPGSSSFHAAHLMGHTALPPLIHAVPDMMEVQTTYLCASSCAVLSAMFYMLHYSRGACMPVTPHLSLLGEHMLIKSLQSLLISMFNISYFLSLSTIKSSNRKDIEHIYIQNRVYLSILFFPSFNILRFY